MKILFLGDVVGSSGCDALKKNLPEIIENKKIDSCENMSESDMLELSS